MAAPKIVSGGRQLLLKIGDGGSPETFAHPCSINSDRGITFKVSSNDFNIPDCADPELIAWVTREKVSLSASMNGAGILHAPDVDRFYELVQATDPFNAKFFIDLAGADGGRSFSGAWHLTQFDVTGTRGDKAKTTLQMDSDGAIVIADLP